MSLMVKRILTISVLSIFLSLPAFVLAGDTVCSSCPCGGELVCVGEFCQHSGQVTICNPIISPDLEAIVENITHFIFNIAWVVAPIMFIIGVFFILTSSGDPQKLDKGRKTLVWTGIGLATILLVNGIIFIIRKLLE